VKPDGGPAFPGPVLGSGSGLTLRDYFAAAALPSVIRNLARTRDKWNALEAAAISYEVADAMLAERER
jgi:hypothetical protein